MHSSFKEKRILQYQIDQKYNVDVSNVNYYHKNGSYQQTSVVCANSMLCLQIWDKMIWGKRLPI